MLATFVTYTLSGGVLDATKAFTSLSLFNILRFPITLLPMMVTYLVTVSASGSTTEHVRFVAETSSYRYTKCLREHCMAKVLLSWCMLMITSHVAVLTQF